GPAALQAEIKALKAENKKLRASVDAPSILRPVQALAADFGLTLGWVGLYFTLLTAWWRGQTPGKRLFRIRVYRLDGAHLTLWNAFERFSGYAAGLATGLLGFIQVYWDPNRQCIQDRICCTVVVRLDSDDQPRRDWVNSKSAQLSNRETR
ncbi:MAG: RDD family protein, partial [Myxococcota bacterium]